MDALTHSFPADPSPEDHERLAKVLVEVGHEVEDRYRTLASGQPTDATPVVLVLDEVGAYVSHPELGQEVTRRLTRVAQIGRGVHVSIDASKAPVCPCNVVGTRLRDALDLPAPTGRP